MGYLKVLESNYGDMSTWDVAVISAVTGTWDVAVISVVTGTWDVAVISAVKDPYCI